MRLVDARLYDFLKDQETGLYTKDFDKNKTVFAFVHIDFHRISEFIEIIGSYYFDEGGMEAHLFDNSLCVELNDIIEGKGHQLSSYKNCFFDHDWEHYESRIKEMEE